MTRLAILSISLCLSGLFCTPKNTTPPVDWDQLDETARRQPENAVYGMELADGLEITLFASEPMLINPTNLHVDERGRVWVCEALNYRNSHNPENPVRNEGDRILILEDSDGDGRADKNTVFYQGNDVNAALGIWTAGNRAVVSCSPNVFVLTDTDGDGRADRKDTLFSNVGGFQTDHAIHAFTAGPDGKFYFNFGNTGQQLFDAQGRPVRDQQGQIINDKGAPYRQGMVFRCNPDGTGVEVLAHNFRNNYEVAADSYGALWQSDNDDDGNKGVRINYVMDYGNYGYTDEITGAGWQAPRTNMEPDIPNRHWHQNDPGVVPNLLLTGSGSPCGITVYEGDLLPAPFQNLMIHAEAGHNVVRAYPVQPDGAGYKAEIRNLVKSKDEWFRPADVCTAPDGSLFIADWYDPAVGGHKFGDPERGRIYRVAPKGHLYQPQKFAGLTNFQNPPSLQLAADALRNPNLAVRALGLETLTHAGMAAVPALEKLYAEKDSRLRARALWALARCSTDPGTSVNKGLQESDPNLRCAALRMARQLAPQHLTAFVQKVVRDPDPRVRREAALCLRYLDTPGADSLWTELAEQYDGRDRWYLEALGIGSDLYAAQRFANWANRNPNPPAAARQIVWRVRAPAALSLLGLYILDSATNWTDVQRYLRAMDFHATPEKNTALAQLLNSGSLLRDSIHRAVLHQIDPAFAKKTPAVQRALSQLLPALKNTPDYLALVERFDPPGQTATMLDLALHHPDRDIRTGAARWLAGKGQLPVLLKSFERANDSMKIALLENFGQMPGAGTFALFTRYLNDEKQTPALRRAALYAFCGSWDGGREVLKRIENNQFPESLKNTALVRLSDEWDTGIRQKARSLLGTAAGKEDKPLPPVAILENRAGNPAAGHIVFGRLCAQCHVAGAEGKDFGPALSEIGSKLAKNALYKSILYPSSGINFGYEGYSIRLKDGSELQGIIESRTASELALRFIGGMRRTVPMAQVNDIRELPESLMTANLYQQLSEQELVDLVEFLAGLKSPEEKS